MLFLRSLLLLVYFVLYTVPYATACFIAFPFMRPHARYWMAAGWCRSTLAVVRVLNGIDYRIEGMENLPDGPPCCSPSTSRPGRRWPSRP